MGYYADLIKQKQEKRNSAESHLKGLIGKKFKRDTDLERAVNSSIYTEISDWSHPRMVVFDKYTDEKYILTTEDNNQYGKDQEFWISKVQKANAKEEKENSSEDLYETLLRLVKKSGDKEYLKYVEKNRVYLLRSPSLMVARIKGLGGDFKDSKEEKDNEGHAELVRVARSLQKFEGYNKERIVKSFKKTHPSLSDSEIQKILDEAGIRNEKEEKDNQKFSSIEQAFAYIEKQGYEIERRDWHKRNPLQWEWLPVKKDGRSSQIEFFKDIDDYGHFTGKVDAYVNSKGEDMKYYEKLAEEKKNGKSYSNEDIPFTKKSECVATLDKIINLAQRKKSQVQGWRYIDEDFDENGFASDLKDALRAVENIIG